MRSKLNPWVLSLGMKGLVVWYGLYQIGHLLVNGLYLLQPGIPPFPPPPGGWSAQTVQMLNGMAVLDFANAILSFVFVYGYLRKSVWHKSMGIVTLTISMYAAVLFTFGTVGMGAWDQHLWGYLSFYLPFIPVVILFFVFVVRLAH